MRRRELCDAATANFLVHASWPASRIPGARVDSAPSLTMIDSGLKTDTFNVVCGARLREDDVPGIARQILEHFRAVDRPFSWWVAVLIAFGGVVRANTGSAQQAASRPTLVVLFTIDQMRPDYFSRFDLAYPSISSAFATRVLWNAMFRRKGPSLGE